MRRTLHICNDCSYSFEARPPEYDYGKHISDKVKEKTAKSRLLSSLRKAKMICSIFLGILVSHETIKESIPDMPYHHYLETSGYFSYDDQYINIDGKRKYRFVFKDAVTGNFNESIMDDIGEDATTEFILDSLKRFNVKPGMEITVTTDGHHYRNAFINVAKMMKIRVRRQRCLFHIMKDLTKKAYYAKRLDDLRIPIDLINFMFFQTPENLERLGKNAEPVRKRIERKSEKEATFALFDLIRDLYSGDPIIGRFLKYINRNRMEIFRYLEDSNVNKTNNVAEHHFSVRSELLKKRFKTDQGLLKTSYWYHRLSTRN